VPFLDVTTGLLAAGYDVRFRAHGLSMHPTIRDRALLTVSPAAPGDVKTGDIVVYRRRRRVIAHRVVRIEPNATGRDVFTLRGDAQTACDAPVHAAQLMGKVVAIEPKSSLVTLRRLRVISRPLVLLWALVAAWLSGLTPATRLDCSRMETA
jgi:signal peptidase I